MNVSVETVPSLRVAIEDNGLTETQCHGGLSILSVALAVAGAIDEHLCALDHQAFDEAFIFVARRCAERWVKVPELQIFQSLVGEDCLTCVRHVAEVLAVSHAGGHVNIEI